MKSKQNKQRMTAHRSYGTGLRPQKAWASSEEGRVGRRAPGPQGAQALTLRGSPETRALTEKQSCLRNLTTPRGKEQIRTTLEQKGLRTFSLRRWTRSWGEGPWFLYPRTSCLLHPWTVGPVRTFFRGPTPVA